MSFLLFEYMYFTSYVFYAMVVIFLLTALCYYQGTGAPLMSIRIILKTCR